MTDGPVISRDSVVVLYIGGRLPSWHTLTTEQQKAASEEHVELMLSVAKKHHLKQLEGYKLMAPIGTWQRFWPIEFPDLEGAEAWIEAETMPPYGLYGHYEYSLARRWGKEYFDTWVTNPPAPVVPSTNDPKFTPNLGEDKSSTVVLLFGRSQPGAEAVSPEERGDQEHIDLMKSVAKEHGLMRLDAYQLIGRRDDWHRAWVIEFPTQEGAEAWMEAELRQPHGRHARKEYHLARKWAPDYFASWVPR